MITANDVTLNDFKAWFVRDFVYATPLESTSPSASAAIADVTDADISKAFIKAKISFNDGLFDDDDSLRTVFLYLSAHYLVIDRRTSSDGLGSSGSLPVVSKSAGPLSESYAIPPWMLNDPVLGSYATTMYGLEYLALIKPLMIGNVQVYQGATTSR